MGQTSVSLTKGSGILTSEVFALSDIHSSLTGSGVVNNKHYLNPHALKRSSQSSVPQYLEGSVCPSFCLDISHSLNKRISLTDWYIFTLIVPFHFLNLISVFVHCLETSILYNSGFI